MKRHFSSSPSHQIANPLRRKTLLDEPLFILGAFAKLSKVTFSSCLSVRQSVCTEQLDSHWMDFPEIL